MASRSPSPVARAASAERSKAKKAAIREDLTTITTFIDGLARATAAAVRGQTKSVVIDGNTLDARYFAESFARLKTSIKQLLTSAKRTSRAGHLNPAVRHPFILDAAVIAFFREAWPTFADQYPAVNAGFANTQILTELLALYLAMHPDTEVQVPNPAWTAGGTRAQFLKKRRVDDLMQKYLTPFFMAAGVSMDAFANTDRAKIIAKMRDKQRTVDNAELIDGLKAANTIVTLYVDSQIDHEKSPGDGELAWRDRIKRTHLEVVRRLTVDDTPSLVAYARSLNTAAAIKAAGLVTSDYVSQWLGLEAEIGALSEDKLVKRETKRASPRGRISRRGVPREVDRASIIAQLQALQRQ